MIKNYLKIAFRNIIRHKAFAVINIAGLAIGMACSIFILLWVQNELSYDRFNKNANEIYRIIAKASDFTVAINPAPMPAELRAKMPMIKNTVRLWPSTSVFEAGEKKFEEKRVFYADSTFLQVFSYKLLQGDRATAMNTPDGVLLTQDMAKKYFGSNDALGKMFRRDNNSSVIVTGVLANVPSNSHLQFDFILPLSSIAQTNDNIKNQIWDNFDFYAYVQLDKTFNPSAANIEQVNRQMKDIYKTHISEKVLKVDFWLQPLTAAHLHSGYQIDLPGNGNIQYVDIFFVVALFILVVACINFMNLATARSARRAKEVGLRKVVGAGRRQLVGQFLGESVLVSFISLLIAIGIVWLLLPAFNDLAGKTLSIHLLDISGSYPALFLSGLQPVKVLKGNMKTMGGNLIFRNGLVVVQFVVSIVLLTGTAIVYRQLNFIRNMDLGFDKSNLLYLPMAGEMWNKQQALKAELKQNPLTANYSVTTGLPVNTDGGTVEVDWEGKDPKSQIVFPTLYVDENFFDIFQMKMLSGRAFSPQFKSDSGNYIINEKAAHVMGMTASNAVGRPLSLHNYKGTIIGVVKDFNYKPIQQAIEPMIIGLDHGGGTVVVRTQPGKTEATIKALANISADLNPAYPFSYGFVDQDLANQYKGEQRMGSLFNVFAILAIFISCMGLYGLSAFLAEQRKKEIGVRKVLGASVFKVIYSLSTGFTKLILIAVLIAVPVAWFAINSWLKNFAYRVHPGWMIFFIASLAALVIAWLTVSYESVKAAIANPVQSLRME